MIKSLTSLRGIFILFIFSHHLGLYSGGGSMAVAFFFVLSGFSMTLGYKERIFKSEFSYKNYIIRRCLKFYPLHWLCLLASLPLALFSFNWKLIPLFFINATLTQTLIPLKGVYFSFNAVSWYLANTLIFAFVFPVVIKLILKATPKGKTFFATIWAVLYTAIAIMIPSDWYHYVLYICPFVRLTDFVFGIFLALGYAKIKEKGSLFWNKSVLCQIIILFLIALLVVESCLLSENARLFAPVYWLPIAVVIVISSLSDVNMMEGGGNVLKNKWLQCFGELSFTIFLTHQLIIRYSSFFFSKLLNIDNTIIFVIFTLVLTILISTIVNVYILNPITQWLTKKIQPSTTVRS